MKVVCKINNLNGFSNKRLRERLEKYIRMPDGEIDLEIGREYTVYGIVFRDNSPWFYLCAEDDDEYPTPFAAECFDVLDERLSSYWKLSSVDVGEGKMYCALVFDEWFKDRLYYEQLIDGEREAVALFEKYRILIHQEYP